MCRTSSRGAEGPGPMTLRQPDLRAQVAMPGPMRRSVMVSQAVASVDAWLARAEEVLQAQQEHGISPSSVPWEDEREEWGLPLATFENALEDLLGRLCRRPGRWILIAEDNKRRHHFWQGLAFEDGSLVTE